jgi:hypothetical protein
MVQRLVIVASVMCLILIAGLFGSGAVDQEGALIAAVLLLIALPVIVWNLRGTSRGVVKLTDARLEVHTNRGRYFYKWADIIAVEVDGPDSNSRGRRFRSARRESMNEGLVHIKLRHSVRLGLAPGRFGTDIFGLPSLVVKTVRLHVEDPRGFTVAARRFLHT